MPGTVGSTKWEGSAETGRYVRTVEPGVVYAAPGDKLTYWQLQKSVRGGASTFATDKWPNTASKVSTLFELASDLLPHRNHLNGIPADGDSEAARELKAKLAELDWAVREMLRAVERLHAIKKPIGLLHPLNVCWYRRVDGQRVLFLPDVGFAMVKGNAARPPWLDDKAAEVFRKYQKGTPPESAEGWARLFRGAWYRGREESLGELDVSSDLTVVARILEWVLTGWVRTDKEVADEKDRSALTPAYQVIRDVIRGTIQTVAGVLSRLFPKPANGKKEEASPIAQAYLQLPDPAGRSGRSGRSGKLLAAGLVLLAVATIGGVVYFIDKFGPQKPTSTTIETEKKVVPLCPECAAETPLMGTLQELDEVLRGKPADPRVALAGRVPQVLDKLAKLRKELDAIPEPDSRDADCYRILVRRANEELNAALTGFLQGVEEPDSSLPEAVAVEEAKAGNNLMSRLVTLAGKEKLTWTENMPERLRQFASRRLEP